MIDLYSKTLSALTNLPKDNFDISQEKLEVFNLLGQVNKQKLPLLDLKKSRLYIDLLSMVFAAHDHQNTIYYALILIC